jgi:hypothetical protein
MRQTLPWCRCSVLLCMACLLSLAGTSWGAMYRCQDAAGRQVFSNLRCPGGVLVIADTPRPQLPVGIPPSSSRVLRARDRTTATYASGTLPGALAPPLAWHEAPPGQEEFATLPERGQRLCQRKPALCAKLHLQRCGVNGMACNGLR